MGRIASFVLVAGKRDAVIAKLQQAVKLDPENSESAKALKEAAKE